MIKQFLMYLTFIMMIVIMVGVSIEIITDYRIAEVRTVEGIITNTTRSMYPCIDIEDKIDLRFLAENETLRVNDVYAYNNPANPPVLTMHRLIWFDKGQCLFKGDNNEVTDNMINCSEIVYKLVGIDYE